MIKEYIYVTLAARDMSRKAIIVEEIMEEVIIEKTAAMENFESLMLDADSSSTVVEEKQDNTFAGPGNDSVTDIEAELDLGLIEVITQDDQEDEADVLQFADTLLACLDKRKVKGKENFKWDGKIQELKDFV